MGLTSKTRSTPPQVFALDLNCAIYHCVRTVQKRLPFSEANRVRWEANLIDTVVAYIRQMDTRVKPTKTLYIGVDGVAPMAKIKQQRTRRFKSAVQAEEEARIKADAKGVRYETVPRWDTNAITPGTVFMTNLATALRTYQTTNPAKIVVSPADEPGEGEQKIMAWLRAQPTKPESVVVYGLDADLIVLSLWASATMGIQMDLFREETEFNGAVKSNGMGEEEFLYMNVNHLSTELHETKGRPGQDRNEFLTDFVALMNLLGNDFVAHGMALKIRDEGIEKLLALYYDLKTPLLHHVAGKYRYNPETLLTLFRVLAAQEATTMTKCIKKKLESRVGATHSREPEEQAMARYNDLPVTWGAERCLIEYVPVPGEEKPRLQFHARWKEVYDKEALWGADPAKVTEAYLSSLAWTLAYYAGESVDTEWYYPWLLPPRFETVVGALEAKMPIVAPLTTRAVLQPLEQLAMVLPQSSFSLLPKPYASLPAKHPHAWPVKWGMYSLGRRFLWECEPLIPLIQPDQMRTWIRELR